MKILTPGMHAAVDYLLVLFIWSAPTLFVIPDHYAGYVYLLGIAHLVLTMCTAGGSGIFNFVSARLHGIIELVLSITLIVLSFTAWRYDDRDRVFSITFGVLLLVIFLVTDYTGSETRVKNRRLRGSTRLQDPSTAL